MKSDSIIRSLLACLVGLVFASTGHAAAITVAPGISPAGGYVQLSVFGIAPIAGVGDETIINFDTPSFLFAGQSWNRIGVVSNGYLVIGGGTNADVEYENTNLPDATTCACQYSGAVLDRPESGIGWRSTYRCTERRVG